MPYNWADITYLARGTRRQRAAYRALQTLGIFDRLRAYSPVLVGTIPLDIDVEHSDLDIICEVHDLDTFAAEITTTFSRERDFQLKHTRKNDLPAVVANFIFQSFPVEIFGQPRPVAGQNAYRHLVVEARLLAIGGEAAKHRIRQLKQAGLKTEPAFAHYFNLGGDPYQTLLQLANLSEAELQAVIDKFSIL